VDPRSALIFGVLIPAVITGIVLLFFGRGAGDTRPARAFVGALALGAGYLVAYCLIVAVPRWPSANVQITTHEWIAWFVAGAIVLAPVRNIASLRRWSNPLYLALFSVVTFRFQLANVLSQGGGSFMIRFAMTLVMYVAWNASDALGARLRGPALPAAWVVAGTGIAFGSLFAAGALFAQLAGAITAGLGAAAVVGLIDRGARLPDGVIAIVWIVFAGALVSAGIYDLPIFSIALLLIALLAPWIAASKKYAGRPLAQTLVAMLAAAIPTGIAVLFAYHALPGATD
jgi:hypothetical protein